MQRAASMWPLDGFWQYFVTRDVAVVISRQVDTLSQLSKPMIVWSCVVSLFWVISLYVSSGTVSMGNPLLCGDFGVLISGLLSLVCLHRLSM